MYLSFHSSACDLKSSTAGAELSSLSAELAHGSAVAIRIRIPFDESVFGDNVFVLSLFLFDFILVHISCDFVFLYGNQIVYHVQMADKDSQNPVYSL